MDDAQSLSHTVWNCKYHVVWIPKYRRKVVYGELRRHLGEVFRELAFQKESKVVEGHLLADHVHMLVSIPPKYAGSAGSRFYQREERDSHCQDVWWSETELHWVQLLGSRLLRVDHRGG